MFQVRGMRIFFLTRHLSLREAIGKITRARVAEVLPRIDAALRALGFDRPRIAVAALNPHAGEGGALGTEDRDEIAPAVADARARSVNVSGPIPADAVFAQALDGRYDAVLSLYHDQGHIAAKTLDFHGAVSVTLGCPSSGRPWTTGRRSTSRELGRPELTAWRPQSLPRPTWCAGSASRPARGWLQPGPVCDAPAAAPRSAQTRRRYADRTEFPASSPGAPSPRPRREQHGERRGRARRPERAIGRLCAGQACV